MAACPDGRLFASLQKPAAADRLSIVHKK